MTKKEREAIRARCEAALRWSDFDGLNEDTIAFHVHAKQDVAALLDALDDVWKRVEFWRDRCIVPGTDIFNVAADRDQWKARAEAMERAIRSRQDNGRWACKQWPDCPVSCRCRDDDWQFDEARFMGGINNGQ